MNSSNELSVLCDIIEDMSSPKIILNNELELVFANSVAKSYFGLVGSKNGVKMLLGEENTQKVIEAMKTRIAFCVKTTDVYREFRFIKNNLSDNRFCIFVDIQDNYNFASICGKTLHKEGFIDIIRKELTMPAADIYSNIHLMKNKFKNSPELTDYITHLDKSANKMRRGITNLGCMITALESVCLENKEVVCIKDELHEISRKIHFDFNKCEDPFPLTIMNRSVFVKSVVDILAFLYEFPSTSSNKIKVTVGNSGQYWKIVFKRNYTYLPESMEKETLPYICDDNINKSNLGIAHIIAETHNGMLYVKTNEKTVTVDFRLFKVFSVDEGAMLTSPRDKDTLYYVEKFISEEFADILSKSEE